MFCNVLWFFIDIFVPKQFPVRARLRKSVHKCYPAYVKKALARKKRAWKTLRRVNSTATKVKYAALSKSYSASLNKHTISRETALLRDGTLDSFYRFVSNKTKPKSSISPLLNSDGVLITDDFDPAVLLNNQFQSVFVNDNGVIPPLSLPMSTRRLVVFTVIHLPSNRR